MLTKRGWIAVAILVLFVATGASSGTAQTLDVTGWYSEPRYTYFTSVLTQAAQEAIPGVDIQFRPNPGVESFITMMAAGSLPDVITVHHSDNFPPLVQAGALLDLRPYLEQLAPELFELIPPEIFEPFERDGKLFAIPAIAELNNVYVNLTLLEEAGFPPPDWDWDWNHLLEMSRRVTRDQDGDGEPETIGATVRQYEQEIGPFIYSNGGTYMNRQAAGTKVTFDSAGTIAALEFVRSLIHDYGVAFPQSDRERWVSGRLAFNFTGSWNLGAYRELIGESFTWDYIPYPKSPHTGNRASRLSVIGISVAAGTQHPEEAIKFALLAALPSAQQGFLQAGLSPVPVRLDLFDSPQMRAIAEISRSAARTIQETLTQGEAVAETVYPDRRMQTIATEAIAAVLIDGAEPQSTIREAARQMREILAEVLAR